MAASTLNSLLLEVRLAAEDDFDAWRDTARGLINREVHPDHVLWRTAASADGDLFAAPHAEPDDAIERPASLPASRKVPREFLALAGKATLHRDARRHDLLYRLLWRLQRSPGLLDDAADPEVRRLHELARTVRRDMHKMRAFVRFRGIETDGTERFVAWFEPEHHILRANAAFFVNRFTQMHWSILTPHGSLHWDGASLLEGPPARREDAPAGDPAEALWRRYYAAIFNPARLKVGAMLKEMPRRYWKNMPEAALIPDMIAGAQAREAGMVAQGGTRFSQPRPASLLKLAQGLAGCRACAIGCNGTRAVPGEGMPQADLMIVGEQPGDCEELAGRPFVGPAGTLLRQHLAAAGIAVEAAWLTNAVKHFKFETRGDSAVSRPGPKRRLHQNPSAGEIDLCRWWLESERQLIRPRVILALGASAARGLLGRTVSVQRERGRAIALDQYTQLYLTTHPSYLLRLGDAGREREEERFAADLRHVAAVVNDIARGVQLSG